MFAKTFQHKILACFICVFTLSIFTADISLASAAEKQGTPGAAQPIREISSNDILTPEICVETALQNRPDLEASRAIAESKALDAPQLASGMRPQLKLSPYYSYGSTPQRSDWSSKISLSLTQVIHDWGRTELSVKGAKEEEAAAAMDLLRASQSAVRDVLNAYYSLNKANRTLAIAADRVDNYSRRLKWAESFYNAGAKAKIEVTKARTDLASAKLDLVTAESDAAKASAALAQAMGKPSSRPERLEDRLAFNKLVISEGEATASAEGSRADLIAQKYRTERSRINLALTQKGLAPSLTGEARYSVFGESNPLDNDEWQAGVALNIPLSDGSLTKLKVKQAQQNLLSAEAVQEALRQSIVREIRTALASLREAEEGIAAGSEAELQAKETLDLAEKRYKAGVGSSLEISDAVDTYAKARVNTLSALYRHRTAGVELKYIMGILLQQ